MNTEVKTIKVKKTKKNNPLKGAIIDIDYNTGLKEVFGEEEKEPIDLFSKEHTVIDEANEELWEDNKQDIEYNQKKANLLKDLEKLEQENALRKGAKKYKTHIIDILQSNIKSNEDAIKKFQDENLQFQQQLNELGTIENDTDIMDYLADKFSEEVNELINDDMPKPIKSKEKTKRKPITSNRKTTTEERWALIKDGSMFRAKHKEGIRYYLKIAGGKVTECDDEGNINLETDSFENNQEAANSFRKFANISYGISGWEFLQLYNKDTDKAKSLKHWDGDLEYLEW
jgi:hypothetical protein